MKFHDTYPVFPFIFMLQVEMCSCGFFFPFTCSRNTITHQKY